MAGKTGFRQECIAAAVFGNERLRAAKRAIEHAAVNTLCANGKERCHPPQDRLQIVLCYQECDVQARLGVDALIGTRINRILEGERYSDGAGRFPSGVDDDGLTGFT